MLQFTGHPLVDVGIATITAFANKDDPARLTAADLGAVADYITREYVRQPLKSFLTVAFPNSGFTQPAFENQPERRLAYAEKVLRSIGADLPTLPERCVFTGKPAVAVAFGDKEGLAVGRAFRQHIPLTTGEDVINFFPYGDAGLPVSGEALLAIQAFPLGTAKCGGRLLAIHSDNEEIMLHFAGQFLRHNRQAIHLAQQAGSNKMPEAQYAYRTLIIDTLLPALQMQRAAREDDLPFSITAYHLSNSGQGVGLNIYHLPLEMMGFLQEMESAGYHQDWHAIINRAWEVPPQKSKKEGEPFRPHRNWLYEDLFGLPGNAARFIRTYFLRIALRYARGETDPRDRYSLRAETGLVSWDITACFLRRILHMDKERIEQIRQLGDSLAQYIKEQNDRRFFHDFFTVQRYDYFRNLLLKANLAQAKRGQTPLLTFDAYVTVFEEGQDLPRIDWRLARDLVLIRIIEQLHRLEWLGKNIEALPEVDELAGEPAE